VNQTTFGKLFSFDVDGWIVGQPLYLQNVAIPNQGSHNVVYVETMHDSVYGFDADTPNNGLPLWQVSFLDPNNGITSVPAADGGCINVTSFVELGITGTPAIDPVSGTIYLVARTKENGSYYQRLHALDAATGQEKIGSPVVITATYPGTGDGSNVVTFDPLGQASRAAVLLNNNTLFLSFASNGCKQVHNHGWVLAYDAVSLQQVGVFNTTPNTNNGGIWQSGSGPAADSNGNIYVETADAVYDANTGGPDYGDSILKLTLGANGLFLADSFTPANQGTYNTNDQDLSSVGPLLLPDQASQYPHLLVGSGKDETVYVLNRDNMGGYNSVQDQIVQELPPLYTNLRGQVPTYWNGLVYFEQSFSPVAAYSVSNGVLSTSPVMQTNVSYSSNGPTSISANGESNGVLWMLTADSGYSTLRAYDVTNLSGELYDSDQAGSRDSLDATAHFALPMIANGRVYVGTQTQLVAYGLLGTAPSVTLSPGTLTFANQNLNTTSAAQVLTVTNNGTASLSVNSVNLTGDFAQTNTCTTSIAAGAGCTINVTFTPTAIGTRTGTLSITDNGAGSPQTVTLSGTGSTAAPGVSLTPSSVTFTSQAVNTTSSAQNVTLTNSGTASLAITQIAASGDFAQTNTCGASVAAAAHCTISVTFSPTARGTHSGSVTITDNAPGSPHTISLSGTGAAASLGMVIASGSSSSQTVSAGSSASYKLSIGGQGISGTAKLTCTGAPTASTCSLSPTSVSVSATLPSTFTATVATTARSSARLDHAPGATSTTWMWAMGIFGLMLVPVSSRRKTTITRVAGIVRMTVLMLALSGCGGGSSSTTPPPPTGTPAGTYILTVSASAGSNNESIPLTLVVQ
jgi:hypothetical protein